MISKFRKLEQKSNDYSLFLFQFSGKFGRRIHVFCEFFFEVLGVFGEVLGEVFLGDFFWGVWGRLGGVFREISRKFQENSTKIPGKVRKTLGNILEN